MLGKKNDCDEAIMATKKTAMKVDLYMLNCLICWLKDYPSEIEGEKVTCDCYSDFHLLLYAGKKGKL